MKGKRVIQTMDTLKNLGSKTLKASDSSIKSSNSKTSKTDVDESQDNNINVRKRSQDSSSDLKGSTSSSSGWTFGWSNKTGTLSKAKPDFSVDPNSKSNSDDEHEYSKSAKEEDPEVANTDIKDLSLNGEPLNTHLESKSIANNESWMTWGRKFSRSQNLSSDSLRKLFLDSKEQTENAQQQKASHNSKDQAEPNNELLSSPKSIIAHDQQGRSVEIKTGRSLSWSFWNLLGKELNKPVMEDAVLFEPQEVTTGGSNKKQRVSKKKPRTPNIIVPDFETVLPQESLINKVKNMVSYSEPKHLQRINPKSFKRVLIVGVHGFFPNKMLRPLIGEPTGTSIKFANEAEQAVLKWAKKYNLHISVQKILLEKEGRIFERVDYFYKVMEKWKEEIQKSDFVFFACHSQGTPVTVSLLGKLIENGIITNDSFEKKLGILAMAGVNNGPYYGVDQKFFVKAYSTIEHDSMRELFEFQNFDSIQSKKYLESMRIIISNNVKICFVGSIDDQLVPLYSAIASHIEHPNIYRACYIDGGSNTPSFVSRVVSISLWLKNLGFSDHGIIKEISNSLAGPLTGGGHSKIYNDPNVYELGIKFILGTNDLNVSHPQPVHFNKFDIKLLSNNPYHLPWCMRGLIFESIRHVPKGQEQIEKVAIEFDQWKPESKVLKDLKYRLSAIKAKL